MDLPEDSTAWVLLRDGHTAVHVTTGDWGYTPVIPVEHPTGDLYEAFIRFEDVIAWNVTGWDEKPPPTARMFENPRMLLKAQRFATEAHRGHVRKFQETPYIAHPIAVAKLIEMCGGTTVERITGYLHDTVEDTDTTLADIRHHFGNEVADLVDELTIDKSDPLYEGNEGKKQYLIKHMLHMSDSALFIKLADRLDNVLDLKTVTDKKFLKKYLTETKDIINSIVFKRKLTPQQEVLKNAIVAAVSDASHFVYMAEVYKQNA